MLPKILADWIEPFSAARFRKPSGWAAHLCPGGRAAAPPTAPSRLDGALQRAQAALLRQQNPDDGFWCGELRGGDVTIEADTIMLYHFLGQGASPKLPALAQTIRAAQLPDGGWPVYPGGPADLSATVKAYWALKLAGVPVDDPVLRAARPRIAALGGIHGVKTYSKFYMALFGLYDWAGVPALPPELLLFPNWFPFNIYALSAWSRAIVIPLAILWACRPRIPCPPHARLDELFPDARRSVPLRATMRPDSGRAWAALFTGCDTALKWLERRRGPTWLRTWGLRLAEHWILEHLRDSDGLGAIFPGVINTIMALVALGYAPGDPLVQEQLAHLAALERPGADGRLAIEPCRSPSWDTALSLISLAEAGLPRTHPALARGAAWLVGQEIRRPGDWCVKNPAGPVGGWAFQFHNAFYPDVDDTAMVMLALRQAELDPASALARERACLRGLHWLLSMQSRNGGWGAFDKDNTRAALARVPFADHNAIIDPPTPDVTGRVLEFLGFTGYDLSFPCIQRAVAFLQATQEADGAWAGRWGVNYLYGTWQVLRGLQAVGDDLTAPWIRRAVAWLTAVQQPNGGWGESCATYTDPTQKGQGPPTPSQTAWALMGLLAAGAEDTAAVRAGIAYLLRTQGPDGTWAEAQCTGTGFPGVYYLTYGLYRTYFPLMALGQYRRALAAAAQARETAPLGPAPGPVRRGSGE